jgi:hypothetical protein
LGEAEGLHQELQMKGIMKNTHLIVERLDEKLLPAVNPHLPVPTPIGPIGQITQTQPTFQWTAIPKAQQYELETYDFNTQKVTYQFTKNTELTGPTFALGDTVEWRVRDEVHNQFSHWMAWQYFKEVAPTPPPVQNGITLLGPSGNIYNNMPVFSWTAVSGATMYQMELTDTKLGLTDTIYANANQNTNFVPVTMNNEIGDLMQWRVRALVGGVWTDWSAYGTFTEVA